LEAAKGAQGEARANLVRAVGQRDDPSVLPALLEAAKADSDTVRTAAYEGLGNLRRPEAVAVLLAGLGGSGTDRAAAERALERIASPEATRAVVEASKQRKAAAERAALLRILGKREGDGVLEALLQGARDGDEEVKTAALSGLSGQRDPKVLPVLLEAAEKGPEKIRPAAVLGCLRFGSAIEEKDKKAALGVYLRALELARRREDKLEALQGLGRLADPSSLTALKPLLKDGERALQRAAAEAAIPVALKLAGESKEEAVEVLKAALPLAPSSPKAREATETLRSLGVDYDVARESGFITRWQIVGPFPNPENKLFDQDVLNPDAAPAEVAVSGKTYSWKRHQTPDAQGIVNLEQAVAREDNVGAYAYAEVTVPEEKRVSFKIGSDDSVVVWLNGKKVHEQKTSRGITPDQDNVNTRLSAGKNRILVKVLNAGDGWAFCLRITDRQGTPLRVEQVER
ncbi:MAG: HEAT repeat domain-containing protein, partial [Thermoanaerobaculia bacterium]